MVLLEDIGALIGLVIALFGVMLSAVTDEPRFDALGSVGIGILLVVIALVLGERDAQPAHRRVRHPRRRRGRAAGSSSATPVS